MAPFEAILSANRWSNTILSTAKEFWSPTFLINLSGLTPITAPALPNKSSRLLTLSASIFSFS